MCELPACEALEEDPHWSTRPPEPVVHSHPYIGSDAKQLVVAQTLCGALVTTTNAGGKDQHPLGMSPGLVMRGSTGLTMQCSASD